MSSRRADGPRSLTGGRIPRKGKSHDKSQAFRSPQETVIAEKLHLTAMQMKDFQAAFGQHSSGMEGIKPKDFGLVMRLAGQSPSEKSINSAIKKAKLHDGVHINFGEFLHLAVKKCGIRETADMRHDLLQAFGYLDPDQTGYIKVRDLRQILHSLGEPLGIDDVESFIETARAEDGQVYYRELVEILIHK